MKLEPCVKDGPVWVDAVAGFDIGISGLLDLSSLFSC